MSDSSLQIITGRNGDGALGVQVIRIDDGERTTLFTAPLAQAYQFFNEGRQICLILDPSLDEIPDDLRG